jgi:hypothetical protein
MNGLLGSEEGIGFLRPPRHSEANSPTYVYQMDSATNGRVPALLTASHPLDELNPSLSLLSPRLLVSPRQISLARLAESARDLLVHTSDLSSTPRDAIQQSVVVDGKPPRSVVTLQGRQTSVFDTSSKSIPIIPLSTSPMVPFQSDGVPAQPSRLETGHVVSAVIACGVTGHFHDVWSSKTSQVFEYHAFLAVEY